MTPRTRTSLAALGAFLFLAVGSVPDTDGGGGSSGLGKGAVRELKKSVCTGEDPFMLPAEDGVVWAAIQDHLGAPEGLLYAQDTEEWAGNVQKQFGWVEGSAMKAAAIEAAGQSCNSSMKCEGTTCVSQEGILNTQWHLEFRPDATGTDWDLVGYFVGSYSKDADKADRMASTEASLLRWQGELLSVLGDPALGGE